MEDTSKEPLPPLSSTDVTVKLSPSASPSLLRIPGAPIWISTPVIASYESFAAVGAAFVTVIVTVVRAASSPDGLYRNMSVPRYPSSGV